MKRILSLFLTLVMALSIFTSVPLTVAAANVGELTFKLNSDNESYYVYDCNSSVGGKLVIPSTYNNKPVTSVGGFAFEDCTNLTSISIPNSVTNIANYAFKDCISLTSIAIPDSVTNIGSDSFSGCTKLTSITIPDSVTSIGSNAFYNTGYYNNESNWENNVLYIGKRLIVARTTLSGAYIIRGGTKTIEGRAFYNCTNLTSITVPDSLKSIGDRVFDGCINLTSITIPNSVTRIGYDSFHNTGYYNNPSNWKNDVLYIGEYLIKANTSLEGAYKIKVGTKTIACNAFYYCDRLVSITLPDSVISIGDSAFKICRSLTSITIPNSVKSIGCSAFEDCSNLNSITIPNSVTSIGRSAFCRCTSLSSITIPNSITNISESLFFHCTNLKSITIPDSVTIIEDYAFQYCSALISITIPDSVKNLGSCVFAGCEGITLIKIPRGITSIDYQCFFRCSNLTSITIPNSVTRIGTYAFYGCTNLSSITIPNSVINIDSDAFYNCTKLTSIAIPSSVTSIGDNALGYCSNLETYEKEKVSEFKIYGVKASKAEDYASENGFTFVEICEHKTTKWVTDKKATVNTPGSKHQECTECGEIIKIEAIPQLKCATPKPIKVENVATGIKFTWNKVTGADNYEIYRKTGSGKWTKIVTVKGNVTSYTDKTAKSGTTYKYSVVAKNEAGSSKYNTTGLSVRKLAMPTKITTNVKNGITVKWGNVTGATGYYVMRKVGNGSWVKIATVKGTTYTDKTVKSGVNYKYTIKAYYGNSVSVYNTTGLTIKCLADPVLKAPTSTKAGITFKWGKVTGAQGYVVYRQIGNGKLTKIATVKGVSKVSYTDKSAKKGTKYTYKLKAYSGKTYSAYSNAKTIKDKY